MCNQMHTFGEKSSFFNLTDGYAGRFIGWLPFAEALQHPLKAVYRFLRRCDLHLPAGGEYPAVEIAAEINGCLHAETAFVHNLRGNILPETVDNAVHEEVFTEQPDLAFLAVEHGELLRKIRRHVKILWLLHGGFLRYLQAVDAVYPELCDLLPMVVEAHEIVIIVVPKQGIWGDGVELSVMPVDALLGGRVIEVAEGYFLPLRDGGLDSVYIQINALVGGLGTAVDVEMPVQKGCVAGSNEG